MLHFEQILSGGDLRSKGKSEAVVTAIKNKRGFDALFLLLHHSDRLVAMRAADAVEKLTAGHPEYLMRHSESLLHLMISARHKELKWHLAQLAGRMQWKDPVLKTVWKILSHWALDKQESSIVRVLSLQALFDLAKNKGQYRAALADIMSAMEQEAIPSIAAHMRKLRQTNSQRAAPPGKPR